MFSFPDAVVFCENRVFWLFWGIQGLGLPADVKEGGSNRKTSSFNDDFRLGLHRGRRGLPDRWLGLVSCSGLESR
jgi:hypothetical protein